MLDRQFLLAMPYRMTVDPLVSLSTDTRGTRTFGTTYQWQCRIQHQGRTYVTREGREAKCNATVFGPPYDVNGNPITIGQNDRFTLPTGLFIAGSTQPPILDVKQHADMTGTMYFEVML